MSDPQRLATIGILSIGEMGLGMAFTPYMEHHLIMIRGLSFRVQRPGHYTLNKVKSRGSNIDECGSRR